MPSSGCRCENNEHVNLVGRIWPAGLELEVWYSRLGIVCWNGRRNVHVFVCAFSRTHIRDIWSLTYTRTCWWKLSSHRRLRKGTALYILYIVNNSSSNFIFFFFPLSVFPFMRRQRHASPSPAQASVQVLEDRGRAQGAGQASSNAAGAQAWSSSGFFFSHYVSTAVKL